MLVVYTLLSVPVSFRGFYPRDAALPRILAMALCLSACLSRVAVLSKPLDGLSSSKVDVQSRINWNVVGQLI